MTALCLLLAATAVCPIEIDDPLHNPLKGWAIIDHALPGQIDAGKSASRAKDGTPFEWFQNAAILSTWAFVEPAQGQFDWSLVDQAMNYWSNAGKTLHIRFSTEDFGPWKGCPEWLYALGVPAQSRDAQTFPDYTHPLYQQHLDRFLAEFARHFCNDPRIESIDLRGYGNWGEWHSGFEYPTVEARVNALRGIIDQWRNANQGRKFLMLSASYEWQTLQNAAHASLPVGTAIFEDFRPSYFEYRHRSAFDYALPFADICLRRDGCGGAVFQEYDGRLLANFFQHYRRPIFTEFFGGQPAYRSPSPVGFPGTKQGDDFVENAVDEALSHHPNFSSPMGWLGKEAADFYNDDHDLMLQAHKRMGYRFALIQADFPNRIRPGETWTLAHTWENRALGRCYRQFPLAVYLLQNGRVAWTASDPGFDPSNFVAGQSYHIQSTFSLPPDLPTGDYELRIAMTDNGKPAIRLAIAGDDSQLRYSLGAVSVSQEAPSSAPLPQETVLQQDNRYLLPNRLEPKRTYLVSFRYRITADPPCDLDTDTPGDFRVYAENPNRQRIGETRWFDKAGQPCAYKTIVFATDDGLYSICWEAVGGGSMQVDQVRVEPLDDAKVRRLGPADLRLGEGAEIYQNIRIRARRDRSQVRLPNDFFTFAQTNPEKTPLKPNTVYTVWFLCAARPNIGQGDYFYLRRATPSQASSEPSSAFRWTQRHTTNPVTHAYSVRTGQTTDERLEWGMKNGGECDLSHILLIEH